MNFTNSQEEILNLFLNQYAGTNLPRGSENDVRFRLLEAALKILLFEGIQALTQVRVAVLAGVRQSHLTYYFPTRSQLLSSVVKIGSEFVLSELLGGSTNSLPPSLEDFRQTVAAHLSNTQMRRLIVALSVASDEYPSLKIWMVKFGIQMKERMRMAFFHYGVDIDDARMEIFNATLLGIVVLNINVFKDQSEQVVNRLFAIAFDRLVRDCQTYWLEKTQEVTFCLPVI